MDGKGMDVGKGLGVMEGKGGTGWGGMGADFVTLIVMGLHVARSHVQSPCYA